MSDIAIQVEDLGKLYRLGEIGTGTISHDLNRWWARVRGKEDPFAKIGETNDRTTKGKSDYVWALKDVNFEVKQGEVLGIIGRNGAGKSTLLKILSKVTTPSTGRIKVKGRIASLLEVGTGFHPELTGRENIFLNGAILGMTKWEIKSKFDEIVDFAGVERYIDTPVKRYSSGMYVRLAFAVAAFLEPEILIVDEVLAVGDAEFQKKCLGRMKDVSVNDGRTVLFVSHNLDAIRTLCSSTILMRQGKVVFAGSTSDCINTYIGQNKPLQSSEVWISGRLQNSKVKLSEVSITKKNFTPNGLTVHLLIQILHLTPHESCFLAIDICNSQGTVLMQAIPTLERNVIFESTGRSAFNITLFLPAFIPGSYFLSFWIGPHNMETFDFEEEVVSFEVLESPTKGRMFPHTPDHGYIVPLSTIEKVSKN